MNTLTIKVGTMPGKLVELAVERGTSAREIFRLAEVEIGNHEVRLDGNKIDLDSSVNEGKLLVAMKMIKGNADIKVGTMPGRLTVISHEGNLTARELFNKADVEIGNHEIRLDGNKINIDDKVENGNLLVAMKMIKGNADVYVSELSEDEIKSILDAPFKKEINADDVEFVSDFVIVDDYTVDKDTFLSIYELSTKAEAIKPELPFGDEEEAVDIQEVHECACENCTCEQEQGEFEELINRIVDELNQAKARKEQAWADYIKYASQIDMLERILSNKARG